MRFDKQFGQFFCGLEDFIERPLLFDRDNYMQTLAAGRLYEGMITEVLNEIFQIKWRCLQAPET